MAKIPMQRIDLDARGHRLKPRTITMWRGPDSPYGFVISYDPKATGGELGLIIPALVTVPIDPQFMTLVGFEPAADTDLDDYDAAYEAATNHQIPVWKAKGFVKVSDAVDSKGNPKRPSAEQAERLIECFVGERRSEMRAQKYRPEDVDTECGKLRQYLYDINGFKAPILDPMAGIMERYYAKGSEVGEELREDAKGLETDTPAGERAKRKK